MEIFGEMRTGAEGGRQEEGKSEIAAENTGEEDEGGQR